MITVNKIIKRYFEKGNVCIVGERGHGKDMLIGNVIARRRLDYISNVEYKRLKGLQPTHYELDFEKLNCGDNTYENFMSGDVNYYEYPYPKGVDVYISDVGVYMPSQYCNELNKKYKNVPTFSALSRQLGRCNVHVNVQNLRSSLDNSQGTKPYLYNLPKLQGFPCWKKTARNTKDTYTREIPVLS